ncbi:tetratricopeptide repeat protein [Phormidium pseudopriestleyi FRX01]|uniref:Tetratricopeptide repeat protein n=1 Tax=Phormidium pseudopriestleyi FRX01 TaxID=1759528 RepID=A0ABS3FLL4_9CYAN|nr:tetratricopeptide repeat protein [Phormidium pseudopriestleyi]MBO0347874.1 tetratricopeptide repeat protein [Phormidium pseudopriestleyi FRX01]
MMQFMQRVVKTLGRIWQQLIRLWQQWFRRSPPQSFPKKPSNRVRVETVKGPLHQPTKPLSAAEYEFLFSELLDGVHRGWSQAQVTQFLKEIGPESAPNVKGSGADGSDNEVYVFWLRQFGSRLLNSPVPNHELARRMVRLGQLNCGQLCVVAGEIGQNLLDREANTPSSSAATPDSPVSSEFTLEHYLQLGQIHLDRRQYPSALTTFEQGANHSPNHPEVLYGLGLVCHRMGLYQEAIGHLTEALAQKPEFVAALTQRGLVYKALNDLEAAMADFESAVGMKPRTPEECCARGKALMQLKQPFEAIAAYEEALTTHPESHQGWYDWGNVFYDLQRYDEAIAAYDRALDLQPDYAPAWLNRGAALGNLHRYGEAIAAFEKLLEIQSHDYHGWLCLGQTLERLNRVPEAIAAYERALQLRPDDPTAWRYRNAALLDIKKS